MNEEQAKKQAEPSRAVVKKRSRFSAIWLLPLAVVAAGGWLVYHSYMERGTAITIAFQTGEGIDIGKTLIKYKGVEIGHVTDMDFTQDGQVQVDAVLKKSGIDFARKDTHFWLVSPRIGAQGITGLETIMSGSYIGALPGKGVTTKTFKALNEPPPFITESRTPLKVTLRSEILGSVKVGSPLYYREIQVGEITDFQLSTEADKVLIHVAVEHAYAPLVRENTKFWNVSGIAAKLGLTGVKIHAESLASIIAGGIAFATPDNDDMGKSVKNGTVFELYPEVKEKWNKWSPRIEIHPARK